MHLQVALRQPGLKLSLEGFCFLLSAAVHQPVSSPGELHPEALSELDVSLSTHTAPIMEPRRTPICQ